MHSPPPPPHLAALSLFFRHTQIEIVSVLLGVALLSVFSHYSQQFIIDRVCVRARVHGCVHAYVCLCPDAWPLLPVSGGD